MIPRNSQGHSVPLPPDKRSLCPGPKLHTNRLSKRGGFSFFFFQSHSQVLFLLVFVFNSGNWLSDWESWERERWGEGGGAFACRSQPLPQGGRAPAPAPPPPKVQVWGGAYNCLDKSQSEKAPDNYPIGRIHPQPGSLGGLSHSVYSWFSGSRASVQRGRPCRFLPSLSSRGCSKDEGVSRLWVLRETLEEQAPRPWVKTGARP